MPTAASSKQNPSLALLGAGLLLTGLIFLARLVTAAPDFDLMARVAGQRFGLDGLRAIGEWRQLLDRAEEMPEEKQLHTVNEFFNLKVRFGSDQAIWGQHDYWATPLETLGRGRGDCEDFTIAKYVTLKLLGVPGEKLRLTYVKAKIGGMYSQITQAHMVLSYYPTPTGEPLVLDNLISDIRPASQRKDLQPVFSFSSENLWVGASPLPAASASARLSRWRDVLDRMRAEGLNVLFAPEKKQASRQKTEKTGEEAPPVRAPAAEKKAAPQRVQSPPLSAAEDQGRNNPAPAPAAKKQVIPRQGQSTPVPPPEEQRSEDPSPDQTPAAGEPVQTQPAHDSPLPTPEGLRGEDSPPVLTPTAEEHAQTQPAHDSPLPTPERQRMEKN